MKGRSEVGWQLEEGMVKGWKRAIIIRKKEEEGSGITPSYLASVIGCLMEPFSKMGTTVESRICGEMSSHLRCVKCEVSADWICWMYGSGAQGRSLGRDHRCGTI